MKKIILLFCTVFLFTSMFIGIAFAAPVARVNAFPNGEGLEEFLNDIDISKIIRLERSDEYAHPVAVVVVPLHEKSHVEVYGTKFNEETFEIEPDRDNFLGMGDVGHGLVFWGHVPGSMPAVVVVVYEIDEEGGWAAHLWPLSYSGYDGSLVTNEKFVPFEAAKAAKSAAQTIRRCIL